MATQDPAQNTTASASGNSGTASRGRRVLLGIVAFAAAFWLLRETYSISMPLVWALLLALGVWPMVHGLRKRLPGRLKGLASVAGLLVVLAILAVFLVGLGIAGQQAYELGRDVAPQLREKFGSLPLLPDLSAFAPGSGGSDSGSGANGLASQALSALGMTAKTLAGIVLILFLMLLMLTEANNWDEKITSILGRSGDRRWRQIGTSVGQKFRSFFTTRLLLGAITAALYVGWLAIFGLDYLLLWGLLAVLLNFVPTIGSIIAGAAPVLYAFVTRDASSAALIAGGLLVIEQIMGNFVDPKIMGRRLAVSPLVVLVSLTFWSIIWGVAGAFLSVPLTVLVTIVMANFDHLKPAALLLTDCSSIDELEDYRRPN